jgi:hypothetical protein
MRDTLNQLPAPNTINMDPPKSNTTIRITTDLGPASQFANSPMTVIELKGRTNHEKGEHYLQLSLVALRELDSLLKDERLSASEKATYNRAYVVGMDRYDEYAPFSPRRGSLTHSYIIHLQSEENQRPTLGAEEIISQVPSQTFRPRVGCQTLL